MKLCVLLLCCLCWRTDAESRSYLITAPLALRLDASETVLLQLFGFSEEHRVYLFLKTSMAANHVVLAQEVVTLNAQNSHQAAANIRLYPGQLDKSVKHVILHVQSAEINQHLTLPVSRSNGFLFIQTDKPLYTPRQRVKVRAFSLNEELRPANRSVFLTFKDPDHTTVDIVEMFDLNNGIPSMQNPFKLPIKPKLGTWSIEASYANDFTTAARTDFEVKEYVLPSFAIVLEPEAYYISYGRFNRFSFKVSARYLHGAPVADGEVFLRYGYVSGKSAPVIIPSSVTRERLSSTGEVDVTVDMASVLSKHSGPKDLNGLMGKFLYIAVLLQEDTGGISQEAEFATVKFVKSPYSLSLVSTPPFIKPGLPYNIQVLVRDHRGEPVKRVRVQLVERQLFGRGRPVEDLPCPSVASSQLDGLAVFICNTPSGAERVTLKFETADPSLPAASQASLSWDAVAYHSPNQRYLYIDPPLPGHGLVPGQYARIKVYSATPSYLPVRALSYLVLSKGKVVDFGSRDFVSPGDNKLTLSFEVTGAMVPSIRLLVYYILYGEGTSELVADSVWLDVRDKCVGGLQTELSLRGRDHKPKDKLQLDIRTNQDGLVALSAVDSALLALRPKHRDPVSRVLSHVEQSDLGCGGGGGKDSADVFRLAGLTFITNANSRPSADGLTCTAAVRAKRAATEEEKQQKAQSYGPLKSCCEEGMRYVPKSRTCQQFAEQRFSKHVHCRRVFAACCEFILQNLDQNLVLGRNDMGADFDLTPSLVRSYFPESWLWEVHGVSSGPVSLSRILPDSLTSWDINAVGMFASGVCVAEPVRVSVTLPLSIDIPLPYQVVRGEQLELSGSVYNQQDDSVTFCVTLTASAAICLLQAQEVAGGAGLRSTPCSWSHVPAGGVHQVTFTLLGLEPGEHSLTFTLRSRQGARDVLVKKLRVVPEGLRKEVYSGGRLDPQGLYGSEKRTVVLKNRLPPNTVPNSAVERLLTINGEVLDEVLSVMHNPEGLRQLVNLPAGSAEAELGGLLPLVHVYRYLETTRTWDVLGPNIQKNSAELSQRIREGLLAVSSFRRSDSSYSMWMKQKPSAWLTALAVKTLSLVDAVVPVDHESLSSSVAWLIRGAQQADGSFADTSSFRPNKVMAAGSDAVERAVYVTSFVLIALCRATSIRDPILQLRFHDDSMRSAAKYISQNAPGVKSVYVRAVATYALTLHDPNSMAADQLLNSLEAVARQKGHPAVLRYWQESSVAADWLKPDQSSGLTVEATAYVFLAALLRGRIQYANPILSWLTQDQHYGQGFYSVQDIVLTLEAITEYCKTVPRAVLSQDINVQYRRKGALARVRLSQTRPVATPLQVMEDDDIIVTTGYGRGVSNVKLKTVFYETSSSPQTCHFDFTIEMVGPGASKDPSLSAPHLVACAKYKPPPNEVNTESTLTVMTIQLPTGVEGYLDDLRQFWDVPEPMISHYELQGSTVVVQMDAVPSDSFLCVGFRVRTRFRVGGASDSLFSVYEPQDKGSMCTKLFSFQEVKLQRLCVADQCQCMMAACAAYRGDVDVTLTTDRRTEETCRPHVGYAFKVTVKSSVADGDFLTYRATVEEVLKNTDKELEAVSKDTEVELIKKVTCSRVELHNHRQYLVTGARGSEVTLSHGFRYRLPLDSDAVVEAWPAHCATPACSLDSFALEMQLFGCPNLPPPAGR